MRETGSWTKLFLPLGVLVLLGIGGVLRLYTAPIVIMEGPTELLYEPDLIYASGNVLATLQAGEEGKLLWGRYSKDAKFYKIYLGNGRCGYVVHGGRFRIVPWDRAED